jgi:hypothetical protein
VTPVSQRQMDVWRCFRDEGGTAKLELVSLLLGVTRQRVQQVCVTLEAKGLMERRDGHWWAVAADAVVGHQPRGGRPPGPPRPVVARIGRPRRQPRDVIGVRDPDGTIRLHRPTDAS